jgi:iron complex outermembrane recepter protein
MNQMQTNAVHARTRFLRRYAFILLGCLIPLLGFAQTGGTGTVEGRVFNQLTGRFLNNAEVTIEGTNLRSLTNQFGEFRVTNVPAGEQRVRIFFTGLDTQVQTVTVVAGETVRADARLTSQSRFEEEGDDEIVELDAFRVEARAIDGSAIAVNEQRFAANIVNVVSADEFGDVTEGNVGEFIKYLPGISVEYVAADVRSISVRGLLDSQTIVTVDGNAMASAASGGQTRRFELEQVSMNNVARIELVKVPRPDMRADTLGGQVNMVSKSAFELDAPEFRYRTFLSINSENLTISTTPGPKTSESRKILPGFDLSYSDPVNASFGYVVNGLYSNQFNEQHRSFRTYASRSGTGQTPATPMLRDYTFQDGPKTTTRQSLGANLDFRPAEDWVVNVGAQWNDYETFFGNRNLRWRVDRSSTMDSIFDENNVFGRVNNGEVMHGNSFRNKYGRTYHFNVNTRYYGPTLEIDASVYYSDGTGYYDDFENGHVERVQARARNVTVNLLDITSVRPQTIEVKDADGNMWDSGDLSNYEILDIRSRPIRSSDLQKGGQFNIQKDLGGEYSFKVKTGFAYRDQEREIFDPTYVYSFLGIDGNRSADLILDTVYIGQKPGFGLPPVEYPSPFVAYRLFRDNPGAFSPSSGNATSEANRDIWVNESITSLYLQGEARFFDNRLRVLTGLRWEETDFNGLGPLNENGVLTRRGAKAEGKYDDLFPSIHFTYDVTPNFLIRLAYANTISRPNWNFLIPRNLLNFTDLDEEGDVDLPRGTFTAINGNLKPWYADNFDLSLEYYTENGGILSAGVFFKQIDDMFESFSDALTPELRAELGLEDDPRFDVLVDDEGTNLWFVNTTVNGASAKILGFEFNARQKLDFLGDWGRNIELFGNATVLDLKGGKNTDFSSFVRRTYNWGGTYNRGPFQMMLKWNYRGHQLLGARSNEFAGGFRYEKERLYLDLNMEYKFSRRYVLFFNARNLTNEPQIRLNYNEDTPEYARQERQEQYGVQMALGIKGRF